MIKKRLLIYYAKDSQNKLEKDSAFLLEKLGSYVEKIVIVMNQDFDIEAEKLGEKIYKIVSVLGEKHNLEAYKCALQQIEQDELKKYDEVICVCDNVFGPVRTMEPIFRKMDTKRADFWGLNKQNPTPMNFLDYTGENLQREYIPSYFLAFERKVIDSNILLELFEGMNAIHDEPDSWIDKKELYFTEELTKRGYKYDTCIDTQEWTSIYYNPLLLNPVAMLSEKGCPFFLKESFTGDYHTIITNTSGQAGSELLNYLEKKTDYNVDLIWERILKVGHQQDINHNLHLNYILDENLSDREETRKILEEKKIALVMHLYFMDLLEESLHYASAMPECADVYITTNTPEKKAVIENVFRKLACNKLDVRVIENRGRDVSSLLVGVKDIIFDYDYVCFVHDKKSAQIIPGSIGKDFGYQCLENTLCSKAFVENVICTLYKNKRLGMLSPSYPIHGSYFATNGKFDWGANYENTKELHEKLKLEVPINIEKSPVAPLGTMFWFKTPAMKRLYDCDWEYNDFPQEPNGVDGTLLHAIERIYSYIVQHEGYYPAMLCNKAFASIGLTNQTVFVQGINRTLEKYYPYCSFQQALHFINYMGYTIPQKEQTIHEQNQVIQNLIPQISLKWQLKRKIKELLHIKR